MKDYQETTAEIRRLARTADKELKDSDLPKTAADIRNLRVELGESFSKLNETLDSIQELVDSISDDPSSLIRGKQSKKEF
jgi:methyl-accepting chemotaxis protein